MQAEADGDGLGDACDSCVGNDRLGDADMDGYCNDADNCPEDANADQADGDSDGVGDVCDNCPNGDNGNQGPHQWDIGPLPIQFRFQNKFGFTCFPVLSIRQ